MNTGETFSKNRLSVPVEARHAIPLHRAGTDAILAPAEDVIIRPVADEAEMNEVYRLVHDAFVELGYCTPQPDGRLIYYPHLDGIPETTVLVAEVGGCVVGTISLTFDGPAGFHVDDDFKVECDQVRAEGRRLAASWRIATRKDCRDERKIVMGLIREVLRRCLANGVETCLFMFNPRHEKVYQRLLGMKTVARRDGMKGMNSSAVFMRCDNETLPAWCRAETPSAACA